MNSEAIFQAAFALVSSLSGFNTKSRRLVHFSEVDRANQPALFVNQKNRTATFATNMPTRWTLHLDVYIYATTHGNDPAATPSSVLNPLIDSVVSAFMPPDGIEQTLGGLCARCRVDGSIETDEGVFGDQGIAIIPITIYLAV